MYNKSFKITEEISNNAFSFDKRTNPKLHVPSLIEGNISDVQIGSEIVFEDFDEKELKSCKGLKNFIKIKDKQIVIVDNHNHVFYFWHEARKKGFIKDNSTLIHIDQHKDAREPSIYLSKNDSHDLKQVFEYTNRHINVGNYILPAIHTKLIGQVISITSESNLHNLYEFGKEKTIILNIDLDFWAPEMDYINYDLKMNFTKRWIKEANLITIATSPFFIEQKRAIEILNDLF